MRIRSKNMKLPKLQSSEFCQTAKVVLNLGERLSVVNRYFLLRFLTTAVEKLDPEEQGAVKLLDQATRVLQEFHASFPTGGPLKAICGRMDKVVENAYGGLLAVKSRHTRQLLVQALLEAYGPELLEHRLGCACEEQTAILRTNNFLGD